MLWTSDVTYMASLCFGDDKLHCRRLSIMGIGNLGYPIICYVNVHSTSDITYMDSLYFDHDKPYRKRLRILYRWGENQISGLIACMMRHCALDL